MILVLEGLGEPLTYDKYASRLAKPLCLKIPQSYDFLCHGHVSIEDSGGGCFVVASVPIFMGINRKASVTPHIR